MWAVLALAVAAGVGAADTASNQLPGSTAGYQSVRVTGATMKSISYTTAANVISAFTINLKGPQVRLGVTQFSTVKAHFGADPDVTCTIGVYDVVADQTPATCSTFTQPSDASWTLTVSVT